MKTYTLFIKGRPICSFFASSFDGAKRVAARRFPGVTDYEIKPSQQSSGGEL